MIGHKPNERAGAAATASDPEDAKASRPATLCSETDSQAPEVCEQDAETGPASTKIDGEDLLDRVRQFVQRFVILPSDAAYTAVTLWAAHAHLMDAWQSTPRLGFLSPEPGSGKSRAMEILGLLVPRVLLSVNSSSAFILRSISNQEERPTVLYDEIDTIFGSKAGGNEELRGLINAGYRRGAKAGRCAVVKNKIVPEEFDTFCAVAMAGLGNLPDTILSRSIVVRMRKRAKNEICEPYRQRNHEAIGHALKDELAQWADTVFEDARCLVPTLPTQIVDRDADVWEPLIAVADLAGPSWAALARETATWFIISAKSDIQPTLGVELLSHIKECFGEEDRLPTTELLEKLLADEEAPWGDLNGKKLDSRGLAKMLREYGIKPQTIRITECSTPRGYLRASFQDAWKRYLPSIQTSKTDATPATNVLSTGTVLPAQTQLDDGRTRIQSLEAIN